MSDILRERAREAEKAQKKNRKRKKDAEKEIAYSLNGRAIRGKMPRWKKAALISVAAICSIGCAVYVPPLFYKQAKDNTFLPITPDASALKTYQTYLKDHPEADFDGDGLDNAQENERGTDVWKLDSDGDGISDYAELTVTDTQPDNATNDLVKEMISQDERNDEGLMTPYKIDDVIFWPDDYSSKTYGALVRTLHGYRFWNYKGWVRFPQDVFAYGRGKDGIHFELPYRAEEKAYKIESSAEVRAYEEPLVFVNKLELPFMDPIYLPDDSWGDFLSRILPDYGGLINCKRIAEGDDKEDDGQEVTAKLRLPFIDKSNTDRFGVQNNTLKDLSWVRKLIDAGECVAVSIYSPQAGEAIGVIYGYTDCSLMVADQSLKPCGKLFVTEAAMRMMNKDGEIGQVTWFEFKGLGFDSRVYGDRLCFISSTRGLPEEEILPTEDIDGDTPVTEKPETQASETSAPETAAPETAAPETQTPETAVPETQTPETTVSETQTPETSAPETVAPETQAPETAVPETQAPETVPTEAPAQTPADTPQPETVFTFGF